MKFESNTYNDVFAGSEVSLKVITVFGIMVVVSYIGVMVLKRNS